jgi:hypothetical protein
MEGLEGAKESEEAPPSPERNAMNQDEVHSDAPSSPSVLVPAMSVEEARKHRKRTLDALYAQRKRDCQRIEKEKLEETVSGLEGHNDLLKQDNERLEALLRDAQALVGAIEQEFTSSSTGMYIGENMALSESHRQGNGLRTQNQQGFPVTNRAQRQSNPQDQDTPVDSHEQLLALLGAVLQGNTVPAASTGTNPAASFNRSQLSSILNLDSQQQSAGSQFSTAPQDQQTPEAALAAAHQQQQQLVHFINRYTSASTIPASASAPAATLTPAFTVSRSRPKGSASSFGTAAAATSASTSISATLPNPNLSQILALRSAIENILSAHGEGSAMSQPTLQQRYQLQQHQQYELQQHQQYQLQQQQQQHQERQQEQQQHQQQQHNPLQQQTPAVDLQALASLLDPQTRAALVQWNQNPTSQRPSEFSAPPSGAAISMDTLLGFAEQQRQQHHQHQQQIAPFQVPPTLSAQYSSSDSTLQRQLASLQAVLKLQQQQQELQEQQWQEEDRHRTRQQKLAQQQQQWLSQQIPHHPRNPQIISEQSFRPTASTTPTQAPNDADQILAMIAALQSQSRSSHPSR